METKKKYNYRQTGITLLACIFIWSLTTTVLAQQANLPKTAVKPIDPASMDLSQQVIDLVQAWQYFYHRIE